MATAFAKRIFSLEKRASTETSSGEIIIRGGLTEEITIARANMKEHSKLGIVWHRELKETLSQFHARVMLDAKVRGYDHVSFGGLPD